MKKKLLLIVGCAGLVSCEATFESRPSEPVRKGYVGSLIVRVDSTRHVACYSQGEDYSAPLSCLPLDSTNSHAIAR